MARGLLLFYGEYLENTKAISRFPSPKWNNEEFEMIFSFLEERTRDFESRKLRR